MAAVVPPRAVRRGRPLIGQPVLYAGKEPPVALIEVLVHLDLAPEEIPAAYALVGMDVPDPAVAAAAPTLPVDWQHDVNATRTIGSDWLRSNQSLLMRVPSAIIDQTSNFLVNPAHSDIATVTVAYQEAFVFDARL